MNKLAADRQIVLPIARQKHRPKTAGVLPCCYKNAKR